MILGEANVGEFCERLLEYREARLGPMLQPKAPLRVSYNLKVALAGARAGRPGGSRCRWPLHPHVFGRVLPVARRVTVWFVLGSSQRQGSSEHMNNHTSTRRANTGNRPRGPESRSPVTGGEPGHPPISVKQHSSILGTNPAHSALAIQGCLPRRSMSCSCKRTIEQRPGRAGAWTRAHSSPPRASCSARSCA